MADLHGSQQAGLGGSAPSQESEETHREREAEKERPLEAAQSRELGELFAALACAQAEVEAAHRTKDNPHFGSTYSTLTSVWDAIREPFSKNELAVVQQPFRYKGKTYLKTVLGHSSGQWMSSVIPAFPVPKPLREHKGGPIVMWVEDDPQAQGSANTYARRQALAAIAGVSPADDDANLASSMPSLPPPPPAAAPAQKVAKKKRTKKAPAAPAAPGDDLGIGEVIGKKVAEASKPPSMLTPEQRGELVSLASLRYTDGDAGKADKFVRWAFWRKHFSQTPVGSFSFKKVNGEMAADMIASFKDTEKFEQVVQMYEEQAQA